ncbi:sn-glycerol-3-phosphate ABC transporter permease UgpE [Rhizobium sullae]|uniref:sn-glycerol-3-phosphate transport system permease protein UgpE n=1 Tax=Rhizobium sullae TaxID=50338 RepID=A0A2N0DDJ6_RHISU|nr:sn-glycerol-3-phosphate ABC transporter permease UgpE [Rhizobium sullae]PKA44177.1 sn-glycerol-3-phosphate ABC transporter permease UgpE [Rhizobium sullae]TCU18159.1 carbohydrate ABC transporter membrane protein 2 (CUT1 family) [Rhizobium sullae]UWU14412.1 sn-glycerol-3-phosphate ABC transporter permease UgpE [Rhizobium sullae]
MVENRPYLNFLTHLILIIGAATVVFPVYLAFIASTHGASDFMSGLVPMLPGDQLASNFSQLLNVGNSVAGAPPFALMLANSLLMAILIAVGKIAISIISAFAIVYFRFPLRLVAFWIIFLTLMLPVEVRILPTYKVVADLGMLNSYPGLVIPLIASATATFLFRQFFLTIPEELMEAARVDGAGAMKFFRDILLPLSRTNIAALFIILFIYGWNQYLWPMLITTDPQYYTAVMGIKRLASVLDGDTQWNLVMAGVILATLPPVLVIIVMQRLFVKGLVETEK